MVGEDSTGTRRRALRADAQLNEDRLLRSAAEAFARDGIDASVKEIARAAGVGVGTLYRRFPSKELLIEATYRHEVRTLCEVAPALAASQPPREALRTWMVRFMEFMAAKHGMGAALRIVLSDEGERLQTRADLTEAVQRLLGTGVARDGVTARDVLMALGGISLIAENDQDPELAVRLIDLLLNGVLR